MKLFFILLNLIALAFSVLWLYNSRDWEPLITAIGLVGTLIAQFFTGKKTKSGMRQRGGRNSKNYQAGGDININGK
ncbi:hypothetical protein [Chryseolinea lacunae]|uniref:Uncharacterized protein n=1 Tax=Chryseolinea lacunae TaxID=2801331 RepID=A0ABS1KKA4_9BACT|nr:hypothetical protein [Chryseolinea lacunae]MBL0739876.1 hypothetical protein [Chryseolinea lacunae]